MITSNHNNFDSCAAAFANSIRYSGTRRINHGHQTNKAQIFKREIGRLHKKIKKVNNSHQYFCNLYVDLLICYLFFPSKRIILLILITFPCKICLELSNLGCCIWTQVYFGELTSSVTNSKPGGYSSTLRKKWQKPKTRSPIPPSSR